jgi:hypothetical protein
MVKRLSLFPWGRRRSSAFSRDAPARQPLDGQLPFRFLDPLQRPHRGRLARHRKNRADHATLLRNQLAVAPAAWVAERDLWMSIQGIPGRPSRFTMRRVLRDLALRREIVMEERRPDGGKRWLRFYSLWGGNHGA